MNSLSWVRAPRADATDAASVECLYVPCTRIRYHGHSAEVRRWVQAVPIVKKTVKWIYYASDSWNPREAIVGPGRISREQFEADRHGYPVGVIPIPGDRHGAGPVGRLFFASRQAAERHLYRGEREPAKQPAAQAALIKQLRHAMADAHPDRGGTVEQFIQARRRYQTALQPGSAA
jgi:hypothetical protein